MSVGRGLAALRALERILNAIRILPPAFALTTVFHFEKRREAP
jgi:hypothetical protein